MKMNETIPVFFSHDNRKRRERKAVCCQISIGRELANLINNGIIEKETLTIDTRQYF